MKVELTPTERKVGELLLQAYGNHEMAEHLNRDVDTVKRHIVSIYRKFQLAEDGIHSPRVQVALFLHEFRVELGVRCQACGEM